MGGMLQPIDLATFPYQVGVRTRVLKPDFENKSWTEVAGWSGPGPDPAAEAAK